MLLSAARRALDVAVETPGLTPVFIAGDVAIATVPNKHIGSDDKLGVLVIMDQYGEWQAPIEGTAYRQHEVIVTSRAVVVTELARDQLIANITRKLRGVQIRLEIEELIRGWFSILQRGE